MELTTKLESQFKKTLKDIKLNKNTENQRFSVPQTLRKQKVRGDKILVALSGGKDSTVVAYLLKKLDYNIEGIHIDLGMGSYSERCLEAVKRLCEDLGIKLHIYNIKEEMGGSMCYIRTAIQTKNKNKIGNGKSGLKNCAICGVIKKWILNKEARKVKNVKYIATGHNLDDEIQTFLINIFKGSPDLSANSGAITRNLPDSKNKFIARIKPLFYILENDVREYSKIKKLPVVYEKCPCALDSYRIQVRSFLEKNVSSKEKENIIKNFDRLSGRIERLKSKEGVRYCEVCGEPSRNNVCKKCELMRLS